MIIKYFKKNFADLREWDKRMFQVISRYEAESKGLTHIRDIHGDEINYLNCRSLWKDSRGRIYRVKHLKNYNYDK